MATEYMKYCEYFDIDEDYFPCIDESAINSGAKWDTTYPHETFISLLKTTEAMLGGSTKRSIWIHGAYGTGKSQCAFALKKILEVPEEEVRAYWEKYEPLKKEPALLEKYIGHKKQGVLTAYRYASGSITTPQQLFLSVQESIKKALNASNVVYKGENTLKESVITWLEDEIHANLIDALLKRPKWMSTFSQSTAEEIVNSLKKSSDVSSLMSNIFDLAAAEGITALNLTSDSLRNWIIDIIQQNNIKIVFIWDEFSDYFRQNADSLGEFQKLVSICQEERFYLMIVTHPLSSLTQKYAPVNDKTNPWTVVQQRFDKVEITLPDNIAFDLIGHAFEVKAAAVDKWKKMTDELNSYDSNARPAVIKAANIKSDSSMRDILPLHPMAALVLKNIAAAFQSNQRSMFDFIKTPKDLEVKAFQWFIQNTSPYDDRPFLTVDMLWDFFYEKGRDYLTSDIRLILDTFSQQNQLTEKEKIILKAILIMQSLDLRLGGSLPILKPTDQNLSYVFDGDEELQNECKGLAKGLVSKGILIENPIADNKKSYSAAVLAGDSVKIENYKKELRTSHGTTAKLVSEGPAIASALNLSPPLKLRYALDFESGKLPVVTIADFKKQMDVLKNKDSIWHFFAVLAVAKTEDEAMSFRSLIKNTISDQAYQNIVVIDALSTPLTLELFEKYVEYSAMSLYYSGNNNQESKKQNKQAKDILEQTWRDRIHDGHFIVYTYANQDGEKAVGASAVHTILQTIVLNKFRYVQDFTKGLSESVFKLNQATKTARYGIGGMEIKGLIAGCEKYILSKVWNRPNYWIEESLSEEPIVIIKKTIDKMIADTFKENGKISIGTIYDCLESTYGFSECNLSCFITGFLLKEYSSEPYRYMDSEGHRDSMTPDKLSEMIGNNFGSKRKQSYIVSLTEEEKAFYELTESAWQIEPNSCSSPSHASSMVLQKMRGLAYPVWCLEDIDTQGVFELVKMYIELVQSKGDDAHDIANKIGKIAIQRPTSAQHLKKLLTTDNCKNGMELFLKRFENGKLLILSDEIGAHDAVFSDIKNLFSVEYSAIWNGTTGEDEIRKLTIEYEVIKMTNLMLNVHEHTKNGTFNAWRDTMKFIGFSCESICAKYPELNVFFNQLHKIVNHDDMLPDDIKALFVEMTNHNAAIRYILNNSLSIFMEIYSPYLEEFSETECEEIKNSIKTELFIESSTSSNATVKKASEDFRKNQLKSQLFALWKEKTCGTKNPRAWSEQFRTPILICLTSADYTDAKRAFSTLNSNSSSESEIKFALEFIQSADFFTNIADNSFRDQRFTKEIVGDFITLLTDLNLIRDSLENLGISAYEWNDNPRVREQIAALAHKEYNAGGSDYVVKEIEKMDDTELRAWLTEIVKKDMGLGVKIINNRKG